MSVKELDPTCNSCLYYEKGTCRFNPPILKPSDSIPTGVWPQVEPTDWCSKHAIVQRYWEPEIERAVQALEKLAGI